MGFLQVGGGVLCARVLCVCSFYVYVTWSIYVVCVYGVYVLCGAYVVVE